MVTIPASRASEQPLAFYPGSAFDIPIAIRQVSMSQPRDDRSPPGKIFASRKMYAANPTIVATRTQSGPGNLVSLLTAMRTIMAPGRK